MPVGIYAECATLFNFTYKCALINKNIEYIWRLHPVIKINILRKMIKFDLNNLPKNIILSNNTLDKDAKKSDCVLYRSSTSAIQVLQYGCVPIYLEQEKQLRFDVVQDFKQKKIVKKFWWIY